MDSEAEYVNGDPVNLVDPSGHDPRRYEEMSQRADDAAAQRYAGQGFISHSYAAASGYIEPAGSPSRGVGRLFSLNEGAQSWAAYASETSSRWARIQDLLIAQTQRANAARRAAAAAAQRRSCDDPVCGFTQGLWGMVAGAALLANPVSPLMTEQLLRTTDNRWLGGDCSGWCWAGQAGAFAATLPLGAIGKVGAGVRALVGRVGSGVRAVDIAADSSVLDDVALACHSFAPGTLVVLADGSTKPIDNVVVGDKVRTTGPATGKMVVRSVTAQHFNYDTDMADVTVRDASGHVSTIHTTQLHRFWDDSRGGGVDARALSPGDQLHAGDGVVLMVAVVRDWTAANWMYDITVDGVHTFYVGVGSSAILVHNCDLPGMPTDHAHFPSQQDALNAALQDNGVVTSDAPRAVYGQNPNMLGPNGGPSWQIDGLNSSGDLVTIEQHPPHFFNDTGTGFGPHYKGPDGFHYFWDGGG